VFRSEQNKKVPVLDHCDPSPSAIDRMPSIFLAINNSLKPTKKKKKKKKKNRKNIHLITSSLSCMTA